MPELPEVETIKQQLKSLIVGKTISSIEVLNPGSFRAEKDSLIGKNIIEVGRRGKVLIITLSPRLPRRPDQGVGTPRNDGHNADSTSLFVHLKMSGQLEFFEGAKRSNLAAARLDLKRYKHLRVYLSFDSGDRLLFLDQRKFGWITDDPAVLPPGIDALDPKLAEKKLAEILASSNRPIKTILLDQSKIAGIGNIYASEILWQAKLSPLAKAKSEIINHKSYRLLSAIRRILLEAIDFGGSTMADRLYRHVSGKPGDYWPRRRVYDRAGEPCRRPACRRKDVVIQKIVIAQRSTYFCPSCQK